MQKQAIRTYEYLELSREQVLIQVRQLDNAQYAQSFPIGSGNLGKTLTHIMISEWYYVQRMQQHDVPPYANWPVKYEDPPPFATIEDAWRTQAAATREVIASIDDWYTSFEYRVTDENGQRLSVTASVADLFTQLALHEVHHRSQAMAILRQLGHPVEDIDFNAMMWKRTPAPQ